MSKLITDFAPQHWHRHATASPSLPNDKCIASNLRSLSASPRTKLCVAVAACLLTQILTFASLASAYEDFELINTGQPACKDCAVNNAPQFEQTRVAMNDQHGQAPGEIGSAPVAQAPPAIVESTPVAVEPMQPVDGGVQVAQQQPIIEQQGFVDQQSFVEQRSFAGQQGFAEQPPLVATEYPQSGGLGAFADEYPFTDDLSMNYSQGGFEQYDYGQTQFGQIEYEQGFDSGVEQVSYDSQYPVQDYGQASYGDGYSQGYVEAPVEYYPSEQTYASYQKMPTVSQQQSYAQTYTSSASSSGNVQSGLAQQKAVQAAQSGVRGHLGGGLGGAKYEGVGWSNYSAQNAINSCCYWGMRPTAQIGVSKGNDGFWYACVLYH